MTSILILALLVSLSVTFHLSPFTFQSLNYDKNKSKVKEIKCCENHRKRSPYVYHKIKISLILIIDCILLNRIVLHNLTGVIS